ncbi:MAG: response regulator transcription factor [Chitinophagaceae bacterium]|nr:response regulator transcription factor [Chitinophagaceae bacterium]
MKNDTKLKVILFDDHEAVRTSIQLMIEDMAQAELIGAFENCDTLMNDILYCKPDVVILDISMPGMNGIDAVKEIRKKYENLPILMLTTFDDDAHVFDAISVGANGYLLKNASIQKLAEAIVDVHEGGAPMSPSIARKVLNQFRQQQGVREDYQLSPKETAVLQYLVQGLAYKQIGAKMNITYDTVRAHMKKIYEKLHVASMTEAVAKAIHMKLFN